MTSASSQKVSNRPLLVLMLLSNAFNPDPRVHREAQALVEAGHRVTILGWDRDRATVTKETIDGIEVERVYVDSTHGRGSMQMLFLAMFWLKALWCGIFKRFDVIHAHDFDTLPLGFVLAKCKRAKLVYDAHESYVDMVHTLPAIIRKAIFHTENFLIKRSDLVITVGEILRQHFIDRGALNVCVVGNWQDPGKFVFDTEKLQAVKNRLEIRDEQKVIVFIANLGKERRVPELIQVASKSPDTHLILGGSGPCAEHALEASQRFPNITYLGYVHPSQVPLYTALADIIFYGFDPDNPNARFSAPNKLFECIAAGKAVLTGDFGEIGKIVREMECGVILPDYSVEKILEAVSSMTPECLKTYGCNSRAASQRLYSWSNAKENLLSNYLVFFPPSQQKKGKVLES